MPELKSLKIAQATRGYTPGQLTHYPGGYQYYLDKTKPQSERAGLTSDGDAEFQRVPHPSQKTRAVAESLSTSSRQDQKRLEAEHRQARSRQRKVQQQVVHKLEKEIQTLEARQTEIIAELEKQETYDSPGRAQAINRELVDVQHRLAELNPEWEKQATRLAALE